MSTSASFSGPAYSRTASTVSAPERVVALDQRHEPRTRDRRSPARRRRACARAPRTGRTATVAFVASRPIRRLRVACTAACASGVITPTTGTDSDSCSSGSAAAVAELHATRISFTPCPSRYAADLVGEAAPPRAAAAARTGAGRRRRGRRSPRAASSRGTRAGRSGRPCPSRTRRRGASPPADCRLPAIGNGDDPPRHVQLGRRGAGQALVSARGLVAGRPPRLLRRALRHGRGRLALLPPALAGDGGEVGRADARRVRLPRQGEQAR